MSVHWINVVNVSKADAGAIKQWKEGNAETTATTVSELFTIEPQVGPTVATRIDPFLRTFFLVDKQGQKVMLESGSKPPKFTLAGGAKASVADVAKKAIHYTLKQVRHGTSVAQIEPPSSVKAAVERAVAQNYMCSCMKSECSNRLRCGERGQAHAQLYLQKYARDMARLSTSPVTVFLAEHGKPGIREFRGGYVPIAEPTWQNIRQHYTTSVSAAPIQTMHMTHVPQ